MKHVLLLFFLVPSMLFAMKGKECNKLREQMLSDWNQCNDLIVQLNQVDQAQDLYLQLLDQSIAYCRAAISHCDTILNNIEGKSKKHRKEYWRQELKKGCRQDRQVCVQRLNELVQARDSIRFQKTVALHQQSLRMGETAVQQAQCSRRLNNVDEVVSALQQASTLYNNAATLAEQALQWIEDSSRDSDKAVLTTTIAQYRSASQETREEAAVWPQCVISQAALVENSKALMQQEKIAEYLTESTGSSTEPEKITDNDFQTEELVRQSHFFSTSLPLQPDLFFQNLLKPELPRVIPLDGCASYEVDHFNLFTEQFYRFLIQSYQNPSQICLQLLDKTQVIHTENIPFPQNSPFSWERFLTHQGQIATPKTQLETLYGIPIRLQFPSDPTAPFSFILHCKASKPSLSIKISIDDAPVLFVCSFAPPPPWQLDALCKPEQQANIHIVQTHVDMVPVPLLNAGSIVFPSYPILDQFVEELHKDPIALAQFVQNEIIFSEPYLHREGGVYHAPGSQRNPCTTFLDKQGSPWEQCQLLAYLLSKAGYRCLYADSTLLKLPKTIAENLLHIHSEDSVVFLKYPWLLVLDGTEWVSLFPWIKYLKTSEGYDLYNFMPDAYASAHRFLLRYLQSDPNILKHVKEDQDDTAGTLFVRFLLEQLQSEGLSLDDVGFHTTTVKGRYTRWDQFPQAEILETPQYLNYLNEKQLAALLIEAHPQNNPEHSIKAIFSPALVPIPSISIDTADNALLVAIKGESPQILGLKQEDLLIDITVTHQIPLGASSPCTPKTFTISKGTKAALCIHSGTVGSETTNQYYKIFSEEKEEQIRLQAMLAYVGAAYFEQCTKVEHTLASLHKNISSYCLWYGPCQTCPVKHI